MGQTIQRCFPFFLVVIGSFWVFAPNPVADFLTIRWSFGGSTFLPGLFLRGWPTDQGLRLGPHAPPPGCGPAHGTEELIGAVLMHQVFSPGTCFNLDMPQ